MDFLYDIVYDKYTKHHRLEFINQQFDYLMGIEYDDVLGFFTNSALMKPRLIKFATNGQKVSLIRNIGCVSRH